MKDITIKGRHIRRELIVFAVCVVLVSLMNAFAIASYGTSWSELYSVWYAVLFVAFVLYVVLIPVRYIGCRLTRYAMKKTCKPKAAGQLKEQKEQVGNV